MALKDFTWFDRRGTINYDPKSLESYVSGGALTPTGYTPSSQGALSILGQTLSGVGAAFAGDGQYMQRQQKINQEQMQSDLEFQALLAKNATDRQDKDQSNRLIKLQTAAYMKAAGLDPAAYGLGGLSNSTQSPIISNTEPTLADAFPITDQKMVTKQGLSSSGKPFYSQAIDPEYQKNLERRNSNIKDLEEFSKPVESFATGISQLREAIKNTPDYNPGFLSKPGAMIKNKLAEISNAPWYTAYDVAFQQNLLPSAQALGSSKVLSDRDLENIKKSLADYTTPKNVKIKALDDLSNKIKAATDSKLKAYGVKKDIFSQIYPNASRELGLGGKNTTGKLSKDNLFEGL